MTRRTKETAISTVTKKKVEERDHGLCIYCHKRGRGEAHFISRAHGGLGIEENLLTACRPCHDLLDNSPHRKEMLRVAADYLKRRYPYWSKEMLIYEKGIMTKARAQSIRQEYEKKRAETMSEQKNIDLTKLREGFWYLED